MIEYHKSHEYSCVAGGEQVEYIDDSKHSCYADVGDQNSLFVNQSFSSIFRASADGCDTATEYGNDIDSILFHENSNINTVDAPLFFVQEKEPFLNERSLEKHKESDFENVTSLESRHDSDNHNSFIEEEGSSRTINLYDEQDKKCTSKDFIGE